MSWHTDDLAVELGHEHSPAAVIDVAQGAPVRLQVVGRLAPSTAQHAAEVHELGQAREIVLSGRPDDRTAGRHRRLGEVAGHATHCGRPRLSPACHHTARAQERPLTPERGRPQ